MTDEEAPEVDPLFVALTKTPIYLGVPFYFFGVLLITASVIFLIPGLSIMQLVALEFLVVLPVYGLGYYLTDRDPFWLSILSKKYGKCTPTQNKRHWKMDSYMP